MHEDKSSVYFKFHTLQSQGTFAKMTTLIVCSALCIVLLICCHPVNAREELQTHATLCNTPHNTQSTNCKKHYDTFPHTNASTPINNGKTLHGFSVITVSEAEIMATWEDGGLDALCQKALSYLPDVRAARLFSKQDESLFKEEIHHVKITGRLYIGARLYPSLSYGWYWAGHNWTSNGAVAFFSHYSHHKMLNQHTDEEDDDINYDYTNWAEFGLPTLHDLYGVKKAVIYNTTVHGWQAVSLRKTGNAQVACVFDKTNKVVTLEDRSAEQYNSHLAFRSNQAILEEDQSREIRIFKILPIVIFVLFVIVFLLTIALFICHLCVGKDGHYDRPDCCCCCCFWSRRNNRCQDEESSSSSSSDEENITPSHEPGNEYHEPVMK